MSRYQIEPDSAEAPAGDTVVVCGPKSAPIGAALLADDPALSMIDRNGRWWIEHRTTRERFGSPTDGTTPQAVDVAYIARHREDDRVIRPHRGYPHSIGSLGAAHYLTTHFAEVFRETGDQSFSLAIRASYDGLTITGSELATGPGVYRDGQAFELIDAPIPLALT